MKNINKILYCIAIVAMLLGIVSAMTDFELLDVIYNWKLGKVSDFDMLQAIDNWFETKTATTTTTTTTTLTGTINDNAKVILTFRVWQPAIVEVITTNGKNRWIVHTDDSNSLHDAMMTIPAGIWNVTVTKDNGELIRKFSFGQESGGMLYQV